MTDLALAVDIGGTKMAVALVDRSGNLWRRAQVPTPPTSGPGDKDAERLWQTLVDLVQHVTDGTDGTDDTDGALGTGRTGRTLERAALRGSLPRVRSWCAASAAGDR